MRERCVRAAAVQFNSSLGQVERNVEQLLGLCRHAAEQGCRLLVLPEMATTGYCFPSRSELAPFVEPIPGPTTERFAELAGRYGCYILVGLPEVEPGTGFFYNAAALVGPEGVVGRMRKVHPDVWDSYRLRSGDLGFPVWDTAVGRIAAQICMDVCYPESSRLPAVAGVDVLCLLTAWFGEQTPSGDWFTRAYENGAYLIAANRWGQEAGIAFSGGSCIISPEGELLASQGSGDGVVIADLDLAPRAPGHAGAASLGGLLRERQPQFYLDMVQSRLPWTYPFARQPGTPGHVPEGQVFGVAAIQTGPLAETPAAARTHLAGLIRSAARGVGPGVRLVVLPELACLAEGTRASEAAEPIPGPTTEWAMQLCRELDLYLAFGLPEVADGRRYNSAVLAGPERIHAVYRKLHLTEADRGWAAPGTAGWQVCDLPLGRVGLMIGHDAVFPEAARCLALRGADVICAPSAVAAPKPAIIPPARSAADEPSWHLWRVRAGENNTYVVFANRAGHGGMGASGIFGPDVWRRPRLEALVMADGEGRACLTIDTRDFLDAHTPNPARTKDRLRMRTTAEAARLLRP